ncbi:MAG: glycosyl hydrolase, partial [Bacteroidota bacterium]
NNSMGGPSQTLNAHGIDNRDWFITNGGDGFESAVDPEDPNIVYAQAQYGWLVRYDKKSGETINIQPQPNKGEPAYRWNWDAPLLVSPHQSNRLFFAANKLFKSDDRGNTWEAISPDLSRQIDRDTIPVMGRVWSMDAVAKHKSTSIYGNIVALDESKRQAGLLYVGTDDGLIHVSDDMGGNWSKLKTESLPGISERVYVNMLLASQHEKQVAYLALNNHKNGDFSPYLFKSNDQGKTWKSISGNLPARGSVYCIAEDHQDPDLLFVGTEFGVFTSVDGGAHWHQLKSGLPTIAVRDLAIQERENDLVLATFGRGFYVLDDYSSLRELGKETDEILSSEAHIFTPSTALLYVPARPLGGRSKGSQGDSYYVAPNPKVGASFTFYLKEGLKTQRQARQVREAELRKAGEPIPYPSEADLRAEDDEIAPYLLFTISDAEGKLITHLKSSAQQGIRQAHWNLRYPSTAPVSDRVSQDGDNGGFLVLQGRYAVAMGKVVNDVYTELVPAKAFEVKALDNLTLPAEDQAALLAFQNKVSELRRSIRAAVAIHGEMEKKIGHIKAAIRQAPGVPFDMMTQVREMEQVLNVLDRDLNGDRSLSRREIETLPGISGRVESIVWGLSGTRSAPTTTMQRNYELAAEAFEPAYEQIKQLSEQIQALEEKLEAYGAPYTPGRIPTWMRE